MILFRRRVLLGGLALGGILCGVAAGLVAGRPARPRDVAGLPRVESTSPSVPAVTAPPSVSAVTAPPSVPAVTAPPSVPAPAAQLGPLLVWTTGGLPAGFEAAVAGVEGVTALTAVRGDELQLAGSFSGYGAAVDTVTAGWWIPLDALAIDRATYRAVVPGSDGLVAALAEPGSAVLSETSAAIRRIGIGGRLVLVGGDELVVTAVVPDDLVAAAEVVVSLETGAAIGVRTPRSVLLRYAGDRAALERAVEQHRAGRRVRFREGAETTFLRHGDAVLPQSWIKHRFGEFAVRPTDGTWLELDPEWVAANIVDVDLPVLGPTRCHRELVTTMASALRELEESNLVSLVDPGDFGGCHAPRRIGAGLGVSRHAWGIAIDINARANPLGGSSTQDPRLVDVMRRWGMAWGGEWLRPDPMHFEYVTEPRR